MATATKKSEESQTIEHNHKQMRADMRFKEIVPLKLLVPEADIKAIMAETYLSTAARFDEISYSRLPMVVTEERLSIDLMVAFVAPAIMLANLVEIGEEVEDEGDEDEADEPEDIEGETKREKRKRLAAAAKRAEEEAPKTVSAFIHVELGNDVELKVSRSNPTEAILIVRDAHVMAISGEAGGNVVSVRESEQYAELIGDSAERRAKLEAFLGGLNTLIDKLAQEGTMDSLSGLGDDDDMLNSPESKSALNNIRSDAQTVATRRADDKRSDTMSLYMERLESLATRLFKSSNGEPVLLSPADLEEYKTEADEAFTEALVKVLVNTDY